MSQSDEMAEFSRADLKAELTALRAQLQFKEEELRIRDSELEFSLHRAKNEEARNSKLRKTLKDKDDVILWLMKIFLGPKSERRTWESLEPDLQLWLEGMALELPESPPEPDETVKESEQKRRKKKTVVQKTGRIRHSSEATILDFEVPNSEAEGVPEDELELVETRTTEKVVRVQSPYFIVRIHHKTYRRKGCMEELVPVELPEVLENSIYDCSFLAGLAVDKYQFHLPLYRQHQALKNAGLLLDRGHLTRVLQRIAELLEPIYEMLMSSVLESSVLTVDETPTPAGRKKGKVDKGYFWAFYGNRDELFFLFHPTRATVVLDEALATYQGTLVCDGYSAYQKFVRMTSGVGLVQCWSHTRREFLKAENQDGERVKWVLRQIRLMYEVEEKARGKPPNKVLRLRQKETKPLVEELFIFLKKTTQEETFVPSALFLKAANYAQNRKEPLKAFLDNPGLPIDTNHLERELRPHAVGRKNWMFHVTEDGARHAAIFYSLIRSCILVEVNPFVYLVDVLQRIDRHSANKTELLIPRLWKEHFAEAPLSSPLAEVFAKNLISGHSQS